MLLFLVACMAAQLGGEETDGYDGSDPAFADDAALDSASNDSGVAGESGGDSGAAVDTGGTSDTAFGTGDPGGTIQGRPATSEDAALPSLEAFAMVRGVAVVDREVRAMSCDALPWNVPANFASPDFLTHVVTVDYAITGLDENAVTCVASYMVTGLEPGAWTLAVGERSVAFTVL